MLLNTTEIILNKLLRVKVNFPSLLPSNNINSPCYLTSFHKYLFVPVRTFTALTGSAFCPSDFLVYQQDLKEHCTYLKRITSLLVTDQKVWTLQ